MKKYCENVYLVVRERPKTQQDELVEPHYQCEASPNTHCYKMKAVALGSANEHAGLTLTRTIYIYTVYDAQTARSGGCTDIPVVRTSATWTVKSFLRPMATHATAACECAATQFIPLVGEDDSPSLAHAAAL